MSDEVAIGVSLLREARKQGLNVELRGKTVRLRAKAPHPRGSFRIFASAKPRLCKPFAARLPASDVRGGPLLTGSAASCGGSLQADDADLALSASSKAYFSMFSRERMQ